MTTTATPAEPAASPAAELPSAAAVAWFMIHARASEQEASGLARAELAARRGGFTVRWAYPWTCQLGDINDSEGCLACSFPLYLDRTPVTDPRARQAERDLLAQAGLDRPGSFGPAPGAASNGYTLSWQQEYTCQLIDPRGALAAEAGECPFSPGADPTASPQGRVIAAQLAADAGLSAGGRMTEADEVAGNFGNSAAIRQASRRRSSRGDTAGWPPAVGTGAEPRQEPTGRAGEGAR